MLGIGWLLLGTAGCVAAEIPCATRQDSLEGFWEEVVPGAHEPTPYSVFNLDLVIHENAVSGAYCFVTQGGKRIDCDPQSGDNLHGYLESNSRSALVTFDSSLGGRNGEARLSVEDGVLHWELRAPPKGGSAFYGPNSAVLHRTGGGGGTCVDRVRAP